MATRKRTAKPATQRQVEHLELNEQEVIERLTRLEVRQQDHVETTRSNFEQTKNLIAAQAIQISALTESLNRYKGFWGGITLLASAVVSLLFLAKEWVLSRMGAH